MKAQLVKEATIRKERRKCESLRGRRNVGSLIYSGPHVMPAFVKAYVG